MKKKLVMMVLASCVCFSGCTSSKETVESKNETNMSLETQKENAESQAESGAENTETASNEGSQSESEVSTDAVVEATDSENYIATGILAYSEDEVVDTVKIANGTTTIVERTNKDGVQEQIVINKNDNGCIWYFLYQEHNGEMLLHSQEIVENGHTVYYEYREFEAGEPGENWYVYNQDELVARMTYDIFDDEFVTVRCKDGEREYTLYGDTVVVDVMYGDDVEFLMDEPNPQIRWSAQDSKELTLDVSSFEFYPYDNVKDPVEIMTVLVGALGKEVGDTFECFSEGTGGGCSYYRYTIKEIKKGDL